MKWISPRVYFGDRVVVFCLDRREVAVRGLIDLMHSGFSDPEPIGSYITSLIEKYRPELAGGNLVSMDFNCSSGQFEFMSCHSSLKPVQLYAVMDRKCLIPEVEPDSIL